MQTTRGIGVNPALVLLAISIETAKRDPAVVSEFARNLSVFLGNGGGTFQARMNYPVGTSPYSVAVGDFNGDRAMDLAVANAVRRRRYQFRNTVPVRCRNRISAIIPGAARRFRRWRRPVPGW